jgi:hypothetical protein
MFLFLSVLTSLFTIIGSLRNHRPVEPRKFLLAMGLLSFALGFAESNLTVANLGLGLGVSALIAWRAPYTYKRARIPLPFIVCILSGVTLLEASMINEHIRVEQLYANGIRVPAVITDVNTERRMHRYGWRTDYTLTAAYRDADQGSHSIDEGTDLASHKVGDGIEVIYKRDNPDIGVIVMPVNERSFTRSKGILALFLLITIIGWGVMFRLFKSSDAAGQKT